jgi:hypothetical protein
LVTLGMHERVDPGGQNGDRVLAMESSLPGYC